MRRRGSILLEALLAAGLATALASALVTTLGSFARAAPAGGIAPPGDTTPARLRLAEAWSRAADGFVFDGAPPASWWDPDSFASLDPAALVDPASATRTLVARGVPLVAGPRTLALRGVSGRLLALAVLPPGPGTLEVRVALRDSRSESLASPARCEPLASPEPSAAQLLALYLSAKPDASPFRIIPLPEPR